ncbi:hypothetical protein F4678DRAFT_61165 [Xylaria arbuscula]|nr:hypothetical protein F4678DRAFT_61165 [Xylaria arbuscula]
MEPPAKKPRLADTCRDGDRFIEASHRRHNSNLPSTSFEGHGLQNTGNFRAEKDFIINFNQRPSTDTTIDHRKAMLDSLRFDQMDARQQSIKNAHFHTCAWFLNTREYIEWTQSHHSFLWIKGKPGAGKSTMMKYLLARLGKTNDQGILLSFFFNARGHELEKTTMGLYRSLILQLLEARTDLHYILERIQLGYNWTVESLKALFEEAVEGLGDTPFVCLIDALDECEEAQIRDMITFLSGPSMLPNRVRICFASRHYPHITLSTAVDIILESQNGHGEDIVRYIKNTLNIKNSQLAKQIRSDLQEKACGVFMWVILVVDILNKEYDAGRAHMLRRRIQQLPKDLHELFRDILTRDKNNTDGLLLCIQWVLFAQQPLTPKQLYFAIISGIEPDDLAYCHSGDISEECMKRYILDNSKGLAESTRSKSPTIQFIHESVRDFLLKEDGLKKIRPDLSTNVIGQSHNILKQCCLAYISMDGVEDLKRLDHEEIARQFPFLGYATQGILYHAEQAQNNSVSQRGFLDIFPRSKWVEHHNILEKKKVRRYTSEVSLLYILAEAGMSALIRAHSQRQSCFEIESERYGPPILAASATKSTAAIQTMLELETEQLSVLESSRLLIQPLEPPRSDLQYASSRDFTFTKERDLFVQLVEQGSEEAALFFLTTKQPETNALNLRGIPILSIAAGRNFFVLTRLLLQIGADISTTNRDGTTTLMLASQNGHTEVVKLLVNYGADILTANRNGDIALILASRHGHTEVVKLLVNYGADILTANRNGDTALMLASRHGHTEVVKLLINYGADILTANRNGDTALHLAAQYGGIKGVRFLLDRGADVLATTLSGKTPLRIALDRGHPEVTKLLQDREASL